MGNTLKIKCGYYFTLSGMIAVMIGSLMKPFTDAFDLSFSQGGALVATMAVANIIAGFITSAMIEKNYSRTTIILGMMFTVGAMVLFTFANAYGWLLLGAIFVGLGLAFTNIYVIWLINTTTGGDHKLMSGMQTMYAVGAFIIPLVVGRFLESHFSYKPVTLTVGFIALLGIGLQFFFHDKEESAGNRKSRGRGEEFDVIFSLDAEGQEEGEHASKDNRPIKKENSVKGGWVLFAAILFFYVGAEAIFNSWLVPYLSQIKEFSDSMAQFMLSLFWLSIIFGRVGFSLMPKTLNIYKVLVLLVALLNVSVVGIILMETRIFIFVGIVLFGLSCSAIYPFVVSSSRRVLGDSSMLLVFIMTGGNLGAMLPYVSGVFADKLGSRIIPVVILLAGVCLMTLVLIHRYKYEKTVGGNIE